MELLYTIMPIEVPSRFEDLYAHALDFTPKRGWVYHPDQIYVAQGKDRTEQSPTPYILTVFIFSET